MARIGIAWAATRYGESEPLDERQARQHVADDDRRPVRRRRSRAGPRRGSDEVRRDGPVQPRLTNRAATSSGAGRMNGG